MGSVAQNEPLPFGLGHSSPYPEHIALDSVLNISLNFNLIIFIPPPLAPRFRMGLTSNGKIKIEGGKSQLFQSLE